MRKWREAVTSKKKERSPKMNSRQKKSETELTNQEVEFDDVTGELDVNGLGEGAIEVSRSECSN